MKIRDILRENQERDLINQKRSEEWGDTYEGDFDCMAYRLTSLNGAPTRVIGNFNCSSNKLTSLEGAPREVDGYFNCESNKLTSLEGAPIKISGTLCCQFNPITSLTGIGNYFKDGYIGETLLIPGTITSHLLGSLLVPKLKKIWANIHVDRLSAATMIINGHLAGDRDILECQEELRSAGLREYGKL